MLKIKWLAFFVLTFGNYLAPVLVAAHMANNVDFGDEQENEGYESNHKILPLPGSKDINKND